MFYFLGKLVVIDFFATWCGPCKMISPKIEAMAGEMSNVVFLKVDVDEAEDVAQEYNISAMPTFIFLKNGQKVKDLKRKYSLHKFGNFWDYGNLENSGHQILIFPFRGILKFWC